MRFSKGDTVKTISGKKKGFVTRKQTLFHRKSKKIINETYSVSFAVFPSIERYNLKRCRLLLLEKI